jgi:hypothetical protein
MSSLLLSVILNRKGKKMLVAVIMYFNMKKVNKRIKEKKKKVFKDLLLLVQ